MRTVPTLFRTGQQWMGMGTLVSGVPIRPGQTSERETSANKDWIHLRKPQEKRPQGDRKLFI